jgi:hypothetical protein
MIVDDSAQGTKVGFGRKWAAVDSSRQQWTAVDKAPKLAVDSSGRQWTEVDGSAQGTKNGSRQQWMAVDDSG